jgi:surface protein
MRALALLGALGAARGQTSWPADFHFETTEELIVRLAQCLEGVPFMGPERWPPTWPCTNPFGCDPEHYPLCDTAQFTFGSQLTDMSYLWQRARDYNIKKYGPTDISVNSLKVFDVDLSAWNLSHVTNTSGMFAGCESFGMTYATPSYPIFTTTGNVVDMSHMFEGALSIGDDNALFNLDTRSVRSMDYMFNHSVRFKGIIDFWNTSSLRSMAGMFHEAYQFNGHITSWDTRHVTNMSNLFESAWSFKQPIGNWNTSSVVTMRGIFKNARVFNQTLNEWDVSEVTDLSYAFAGTQHFNQPLNHWNTGKVETMSHTFDGATAFNGDISTWNTAGVGDMSYMFNRALDFNSSILHWDVQRVRLMTSMFGQTTAFNQSLICWNPIFVVDVSGMFGSPSDEAPPSAFQGNLSTWDLPPSVNSAGFAKRSLCACPPRLQSTSGQYYHPDCTSFDFYDPRRAHCSEPVDSCAPRASRVDADAPATAPEPDHRVTALMAGVGVAALGAVTSIAAPTVSALVGRRAASASESELQGLVRLPGTWVGARK